MHISFWRFDNIHDPKLKSVYDYITASKPPLYCISDPYLQPAQSPHHHIVC